MPAQYTGTIDTRVASYYRKVPVVPSDFCCDISPTLQLVSSLGSMRPLCCDQPEALTQGNYPRVDSMVINAAPRRREQLPRQNKHYKIKLMSLSACLAHNDGWAGRSVFPNRFLLSLAAPREPTIQVGSSCLFCTAIRLFSHPGDGLLPSPGFAPRLLL